MSEAIYTARCEQAWDGDSFGNEWECGASVYAAHDAKTFKVYEDDGSGNGDKLAEFDSAFVARQYADLYVRFLDAGGYSGSPEAPEPHPRAQLGDAVLAQRAAPRVVRVLEEDRGGARGATTESR